MKKIIPLIVVLVTFPAFYVLNAQNKEVDSLEKLLRLYPEKDITRVNLLNEIAWVLYSNDNERTLKYAQEAGEIADEIDFTDGKAASLNLLGVFYFVKGYYPLSLEYFQKALILKEQVGNKTGIASCLNNIGAIHLASGNFEESLDNFQKSLKIKEELGDIEGIPSSYNNIGNIQIELGNLEKALYYYEKSLKIKKELNDKKGIAASYENIGLLYVEQGKFSEALEDLQKSLEIHNKLGDRYEICRAYLNIGNVYIKLKKDFTALDYTLKSLKIAEELDLIDIRKDIRFSLSHIYANTNNYKKAYENHVFYKELNDSIFNEENLKKIAALTYQHKYEIEKKANELERQKEKIRLKIRQILIYTSVILLFIISAILFRIKMIKMQVQRDAFLREIQMLKSEAAMFMASTDKSILNGNLNRKKINESIQGELNDSDWNVLSLLVSNPNIKNRRISDQISLSYDGVRSSLRKMYRIFDITNTNENQRMELVIRAIRISNSK